MVRRVWVVVGYDYFDDIDVVEESVFLFSMLVIDVDVGKDEVFMIVEVDVYFVFCLFEFVFVYVEGYVLWLGNVNWF